MSVLHNLGQNLIWIIILLFLFYLIFQLFYFTFFVLFYFIFIFIIIYIFIFILLLVWIGIVSSPQPRTKLNINKYNSNLTIFAWIDFTWVLVFCVHRTVRMRRAPVLASSLALIWVLIGQAFGYMWTSLHLSMLCVYTEHNSKLSIFLQNY